MSSDGIGASPGACDLRSAPTPGGAGRKALASRINGAKSRGPRTAAGKARSARNALKHGLCARKLLLADENAAAFAAFEKALLADLAPEGALQTLLARQIVAAAWRLARADRLEAEVVSFRISVDGSPGLAVIRDGNGARALPTLLRYRGGALAELTRLLRTLRALQAEARSGAAAAAETSAPAPMRPAVFRPASAAAQADRPVARATQPNEPKHCGDPGKRGRPAARPQSGVTPAGVWSVPLPMPGGLAVREFEGAVPDIRMAQGTGVGVAGKRAR